MLGFPFFDTATGSLGQGLSVAAGLADAARVDRFPKRIFCLIGDESREGQGWEAVDFCADHRLGGVAAIVDCNTLGQSEYVSHTQDWEHLAAKAKAFGTRTEIIDGHDPEAIERVLRIEEDGRPLAVIARTVNGWSVPSLGGTDHHGTSVKVEALAGVLAELEERARSLGVIEPRIAEQNMVSAAAERSRQPIAFTNQHCLRRRGYPCATTATDLMRHRRVHGRFDRFG